jgi:hypothetical protein
MAPDRVKSSDGQNTYYFGRAFCEALAARISSTSARGDTLAGKIFTPPAAWTWNSLDWPETATTMTNSGFAWRRD